MVSGAAQVVSAMLPDPALRRLATLLDGFAAELAACCPGATLDRVPERRWADLWSRATLLTVPGAAGTPVTARSPAGCCRSAWTCRNTRRPCRPRSTRCSSPRTAGPRLVRAGVSVPKPDTVVGAGLWQLLRPHLSLLAAVSEGRSMDLADMPVTAEGDLVWTDDTPGRVNPPTPSPPPASPCRPPPARRPRRWTGTRRASPYRCSWRATPPGRTTAR